MSDATAALGVWDYIVLVILEIPKTKGLIQCLCGSRRLQWGGNSKLQGPM